MCSLCPFADIETNAAHIPEVELSYKIPTRALVTHAVQKKH